MEVPSTPEVPGRERDTPIAPASAGDPSPEAASEQPTAEEVWRALKATQRDGERHPRVEDMVAEVERMTGAAATDVAAARLLDMAQRLTGPPPPAHMLRIARLVLDDSEQLLPPQQEASGDAGSLSWHQVPPHLVVGVVCVHMTMELLDARRTGGTVGAPLDAGSVHAFALALALVGVSAKGGWSACTQTDQLKGFLSRGGGWWRLDDPAAAKEVTVFTTALNRAPSITDVQLPISLTQAGPGAPWGLACPHLHHVLSANSTVKSLTVFGATVGSMYEFGYARSRGAVPRSGEAGGGGDAHVGAPSPHLRIALPALPASWSNATLRDFLFMCEEKTHPVLRWVQMDDAFDMITHLRALRTITVRRKRSDTDPPTHSTVYARSYYLATCAAWSENCLGLLKHVLATTSTLTTLSLLLQAPAALVDCLSHNPGTLQKLELCLDVRGREAIFKLLTPGATPPAACAVTSSLKRLNLFDMGPARHSSTFECKSCELRRSGNVERVEEEVEEEAKALAAMIVSNTSLLRLLLYDAKYSPRQWATIIFPALAHNSTLEDLEVIECTGVDARHGVAEAMLSMLQRNTTLRRIMLQGTPLQAQGQGAAIQAQLQSNREYRATLADLPSMSVNS